MKAGFLVICCLVLPIAAMAQPDTLWSRRVTFDSTWEDFRTVINTQDHGFVAAGDIWRTLESTDALVAKFDSVGILQWAVPYGGDGYQSIRDVIQTVDGGFIGVGYTSLTGNEGDYDAWLVKISADGDSLWSRTYDDIYDLWFVSVEAEADSGMLLTGFKPNPGDPWNSADLWMMRTNAEGDSLWTHSYDLSSIDQSVRAWPRADGGVDFAGNVSNQSMDSMLVMWLDSTGSITNSHRFGAVQSAWCESAERLADGGVLLPGERIDDAGNSLDVLASRVDSAGNLVWEFHFDAGDCEECHGGCQMPDGGFVLIGEVSPAST